MTAAELVGIERRGAVAQVTVNRPEALNALNMGLARAGSGAGDGRG
ncbi:hypothetical protein [Niveispirillum lacus]|nr:hypothetical protein [Niveispirillum lacus]